MQTPDDGELELAWGYKLKRIYEGYYPTIVTNALNGLYNRGVISDGYVIDHAKVTKSRGAKGRLEIDYQSIGGYLNPDEWNITSEDLAPRIERHPMFASLDAEDFTKVQTALDAPDRAALKAAKGDFKSTSDPDLANQLYEMMRKGQETYYLSAYRYSWSQYYLSGFLPVPNVGGTTYIAPAGPAGFTLPYGYSWLRLADDAGQANWSPLGGIEKITYNWLGAPDGHWNPTIYPPSGY